MATVVPYRFIDDNDFEKVIPLAQTGAGVTPINTRIDDGDIPGKIKALEIAAGVPAGLRSAGLMDRKDWLVKLQRAQQQLNTKVTTSVSIATPSVVTLTSHGYSIGTAFRFSTPGTLPTGINTTQTYYVATPGFGANAFQYSATPGGASINTTGSQSGTHSVYAV